MEYFFILLSFLVGFCFAWILFSRKLNSLKTHSNETEKQLYAEKTACETEKLLLKENVSYHKIELEKIQHLLTNVQLLADERGMELVSFQTKNDVLTDKLESQKRELAELQQRLTTEFENIANRILKARSVEFTESNTKTLSEVLNPLKERIVSFEKKVEETYDKELRDKISLREEVRKLAEMNARVSEEANNLTRALKGDVKKQGNWGEVVLERVLERSGLTKGQEYEREQVIEGSDSAIQRPDVIIHLPDNKHIIIDSKVSLVAYDRYIAAETDAMRESTLRDHISSLRTHVKLLSEKNYQNALHINAPDFVLMFVPVEASFSVAVQADTDLFSFAWERKIVIVSPTTLLATLRTVASIWKQENQTRNAQEIARLSGALYDKFLGFLDDMTKIKASIDKSASAYDDAVRKMKDGNGNILRTAERIKELGAKTGNKTVPAEFKTIGNED